MSDPNRHILSESTFFAIVKTLPIGDRSKVLVHDAQLRAQAAAVAPSPDLSDVDVVVRKKIVDYLRALGGDGRTVRAAQTLKVAELIEAGTYLETP